MSDFCYWVHCNFVENGIKIQFVFVVGFVLFYYSNRLRITFFCNNFVKLNENCLHNSFHISEFIQIYQFFLNASYLIHQNLLTYWPEISHNK